MKPELHDYQIDLEVWAYGLRRTDQQLEWPCISDEDQIWIVNLNNHAVGKHVCELLKDLGMDVTNFYNQYKSIERKNKRPTFFFWIESLVFEMVFEFGPKKKKKRN